MQPTRGHAVVATVSAVGGALALALTVLSGDFRSPGTLLAVVLLANAVVRYQLARR
jgi:hypothetical protein